ncbi:MAG TPA: hypothetical protein VMS18_09005 [Candidatus Binatia bacterium]|nr:hypothetical protein [Candidatus Binatia bacterium]
MASCTARDELRSHTLANLEATDWKGTLTVEFDDPRLRAPVERAAELFRRILRVAAKRNDEIFLFLEDDLDFNRYLFHNLASWTPLQRHIPGNHFYASLYNPGVHIQRSYPNSAYGEASPASVLGSQALILSRATARYVITHWGVEPGPFADCKVARLAGRVCPLFYHLPSLVQHIGTESLWRGPFHEARDFNKLWKAL